MRNYCVRFWCLFPVFLFAFLLAGCDVENVEYEDDDTYALFDRPGMAPSPAEVQTALDIIAAGAPINAIPGAYATLMDFLDVTISGDISPAAFTVSQLSALFGQPDMNLCTGKNPQFIITEILKAAITESKEDDFDPDDPKNSALLAVVKSFERRGISNAADVNGNTVLSTGDFFLLMTSVYQSTIDPVPGTNRWAELIDAIFAANSCGQLTLPTLEEFLEDSDDGIQVSAPHQGEFNIG